MLSLQYKAGTLGPLTDNAFQFVWNFDEFKGVGLGNPSANWAHPFSKIQSTFAGFHEYFSIEPCIGAGYSPQPGSFALSGFSGGPKHGSLGYGCNQRQARPTLWGFSAQEINGHLQVSVPLLA